MPDARACDNIVSNDQRIPPLLQWGDWGMFLRALTPFAHRQVHRFRDTFPMFVSEAPGFSAAGNLVIASPAMPWELERPSWLAEDERPAWMRFHKAWSVAYARFCSARSLLPQLGNSPIWRFTWPELSLGDGPSAGPSLNQEQDGRLSCLVVDESDETGHIAILLYSLVLAAGWHAWSGGLCLHSAGVARGHDGFLFLGDSEAGKSTVARLSAQAGYTLLGDDLNFVMRRSEAGYVLAAGPSVQLLPGGYSPARPALRGVFTLVQDADEYLVPLSPRQTARALFDSMLESPPGRKLPDRVVGLAFKTACDIARRVPGHELHFRKCPDFWKLIDEQFPG